MKVLIDLDRALAEGKISREEYGRLRALGSGQTSAIRCANDGETLTPTPAGIS